jgi:uncharacterized protein DUF5994
MASPRYQPVTARVRFDPVRLHHTVLDGSWWPESTDLGVELPLLLPALHEATGPVTRLLLSAAGWTTRPHQVSAAGRTVSVGYLADQSPSMMTVLGADGRTFILHVVPAGPDENLAEAAPRQRTAR